MLREISSMLDTHFSMDILNETKGYFLVNIKEFGWKVRLEKVLNFLSRIETLENIKVRKTDVTGEVSLVDDRNWMEVVLCEGVAFEEVREKFLQMTSPFSTRTNIWKKDKIIIQDLKGIDFFEAIVILKNILDFTKLSLKTEEINQKSFRMNNVAQPNHLAFMGCEEEATMTADCEK
ncbi:MAG: hypothetical protein PHI66_00250 [Candidatus Pacebacteria bacterium]|nr:hypothetical protein [Candidatus Paceibacterota bacterium]